MKLRNPSLILIILLSFSCQQHPEEFNNYGQLNPLAPPETSQFGQFTGKWDCQSKDLMPDGSWKTSKATWTFEYVMNGFAIRDIWHERRKDKTNNTERLKRDFHGWNIRIFNPATQQWEIIWIDNRNNTISPKWIATKEGNSLIVQDGSGQWQIRFYNISTSHFDWVYEIKNKKGQWNKTSVISAIRMNE